MFLISYLAFDCFFQTFTPMHQIALNMGFENWKY